MNTKILQKVTSLLEIFILLFSLSLHPLPVLGETNSESIEYSIDVDNSDNFIGGINSKDDIKQEEKQNETDNNSDKNNHDTILSKLKTFIHYYDITLNDFYFDEQKKTIKLDIKADNIGSISLFSQEILGTITIFIEDYFFDTWEVDLTRIQYIVNGENLENLISKENIELKSFENLNSIESNELTLCDIFEPSKALVNNNEGNLKGATITINPGHGYVLGYYTSGSWNLQRGYHPPENPTVEYGLNVGYGYKDRPIIEDFTNMEIAIKLYNKLVDEGATVFIARDPDTESGNGVSGYPRWQEGAKHYLEAIGAPEDIYNTSASSRIDYKDWSSRPKWANCSESDILVGIHNNGFDRPAYRVAGYSAARGTETWYYTDNNYNTFNNQLSTAVNNNLINSMQTNFDGRKITQKQKVIDIFGEVSNDWQQFFNNPFDHNINDSLEKTLYFQDDLNENSFNVITDESIRSNILQLWQNANSFTWFDRGVKNEVTHDSYYREIMDAELPATLVELAFINSYLDEDLPTETNSINRPDHAVLQTESGKDIIVDGIYNGILEYFSEVGPDLSIVPGSLSIHKTHIRDGIIWDTGPYQYHISLQIQNTGDFATKARHGKICFKVSGDETCYGNETIGEIQPNTTKNFSFTFENSDDISEGTFIIEKVVPREKNQNNNTETIGTISYPSTALNLKKDTENINHQSKYRFGIKPSTPSGPPALPDTYLTIENGGSENLTITNISITGTNANQFQISSLTFPFNISAHDSSSFKIGFTPTSSGFKTATLEITSNDSISPYQVTLNGVGDNFNDVQDNEWYTPYIKKAGYNKFINGYDSVERAGDFGPADEATRAEILQMAYNTISTEIIDHPNSTGFLDVNSGDWYYQLVLDAKERGYVNGKRPYQPQKSHMEALFGEGDDKDKWQDFFKDPTATQLEFTNNFPTTTFDSINDHNRKNLIYSMWNYNPFEPNENVTRAEAMKIIHNVVMGTSEEPDCSENINFPDVSENDWFYNYVCWGATTESVGDGTIVAGYPDGFFKPADNINRAEMAKIVVNSYCSKYAPAWCKVLEESLTESQSNSINNISNIETGIWVMPHTGYLYEQITDPTNPNPPGDLHLPNGDTQTLNEGESITITGDTHDIDGDELFYFWNATGGTFTTTDPVKFSEITWTAPAVESTTTFFINMVRGDGRGYIGKGQYEITVLNTEGGGWSWEHPLPQGNTLNNIWGSSGNNIFAIGNSGTILRYNGYNWVVMNTPIIDSNIALNDVWGSNYNNVFAVGNDGVILHYNGSSWTEMSSPVTTNLHGIWGSDSNNIYAVGEGGTILKYDGNNWTELNTGITYYLYDIWGTSSNNIYTVGSSGKIYHYDGTNWNEVSGNLTSNTLRGIWGNDSNNIFVVGSSGKILNYNGTAWSLMSSGITRDLHSIWGTDENNIYTIGKYGKILNYNGTTWVEMTNPLGTTYEDDLFGIWGTADNNVLAVGKHGTILKYDNLNWTEKSEGTTEEKFNDIWVNSSTEKFAVGDNGTIYNYENSKWVEMTSNTTNDLYGVWGTANNNVYTVGAGGVIKHYNGSIWETISSGTTNDLYDIWGNDSNNIFVVGKSGIIKHYNGSTLETMTSGTTSYLRGVWGSDSNNVYAVGGSETILHYNGTNWTEVHTGVNYLYDIWGTGTNNIYAVGLFGTILHYNGSTWESMNSGTTNTLNGVWGSGNKVYAVGSYGVVLEYDGNIWVTTPFNTGNDLNEIYGISENEIFISGNYGTILRYGGPRITLTSCTPPSSGDWTVTESCTFTGNEIASANVIVQNNAVLTIADTASLNIDLTNYKLEVVQGSGILVKQGGKIY